MTDAPATVSVERIIASAPEPIFALLADPSRHREIDGSGTVRDAREPSTRLALGARFGMAMHMGVGYSMTNEVIEYEELRRIAWQTRPSAGWQARFFGGRIWRYELEPVPGGTLVRESWDVSHERGPIKRLLQAARVKAQTGAAMEKTLANIARLTEGAPGAELPESG